MASGRDKGVYLSFTWPYAIKNEFEDGTKTSCLIKPYLKKCQIVAKCKFVCKWQKMDSRGRSAQWSLLYPVGASVGQGLHRHFDHRNEINTRWKDLWKTWKVCSTDYNTRNIIIQHNVKDCVIIHCKTLWLPTLKKQTYMKYQKASVCVSEWERQCACVFLWDGVSPSTLCW